MRSFVVLLFGFGLLGCATPGASASRRGSEVVVPFSATTGSAVALPPEPCEFDGGPGMDFVPAELKPTPDDPAAGRFTLRQATEALGGKGSLFAVIETDLGTIDCELWHEAAPYTVANFVGLTRGLRPFLDPATEQWQTRPAYNGTTFHRRIPGFMIQGGDPSGTGQGGPGYVIPDEGPSDAAHDRPGLLCMANRGPDTNGMQFFIQDGAASHLDGTYTIFGSCGPLELIHRIATTEAEDETSAPRIQTVTIELEKPCSEKTHP